MPVARLSGGQRQAIAVARTVSSDADILLLDEPLAAMGAKEGGLILDLIARLKAEGNVSIIMILHNYAHVFAACDRVSLIQDGVISLDKPTSRDLGGRAQRDRGRGVPARAEAARPRKRRRSSARESAASAQGSADRATSRERPGCAIGIDFGTESGRALLLDLETGEELAVSVAQYASGVIDRDLPETGEALPPDWALQDPDDWAAVIETACPK